MVPPCGIRRNRGLARADAASHFIVMNRLLELLLLTTLAASHVGAQAPPTAQISGRITDENGAVVAGARVSLLGTPRHTYSDAAGAFTLAGLSPRTYALRVQRIGFTPSAIDSIVLAPGQNVERLITLQQLPTRLSQVVV